MSQEAEKLRKKLGLSQDELAECLGLAGRNVVSRWTTGRRAIPEPVRRLLYFLNKLPVDEANAILDQFKNIGRTRK